MSRISDLMVRRGEIEGQRHLNKGAAWANTAIGLSQILPGARRREQEQRDLEGQQRLLDSRLRSESLQQTAAQRNIDAHDNAAMDREEAKDLARTTQQVTTWLTTVESIADPAAKQAAYAEGRNALIAEGRLQPAEAPPTYAPGWSKFYLANRLLPATEIFKQMFPEPEAKKTREVSIRRPDGSTEIRIVEDTPGQTFESAAPQVTDQEWVVRGGKLTPIAKGTRQPGDQPYQEPSTAQPETFTLVSPDGQQRVVQGVQQANDLMSQGWQRYDATTVRNAPAADKLAETQVQRATDGLAIIDFLVKHPNFDASFGSWQGAMPDVRQGPVDIRAAVERLSSLVTLPEMQSLRGLGPASDRDVRIVETGATMLKNARISEAAARAELKRIHEALTRLKAAGEAARRGAQTKPMPSHHSGGAGAPGHVNPFR